MHVIVSFHAGGSELSYKAAHDIETLLFTGEQDAAYKAKIKQLHLALKKNSELREKVRWRTWSFLHCGIEYDLLTQ